MVSQYWNETFFFFGIRFVVNDLKNFTTATLDFYAYR